MSTCIPPAKALATCIVLIGSQHNDSRSDGSQPSDGLLCIMHVMRLHIFECQNYGLSAKCVRTHACTSHVEEVTRPMGDNMCTYPKRFWIKQTSLSEAEGLSVFWF